MVLKIAIIILLFLLNSCFVISMTPSYSPLFKENIWINKITGEPLSREYQDKCKQEISNSTDIEKDYLYANCLRKYGFVFNASYTFCYKFEDICNKYDKYRK